MVSIEARAIIRARAHEAYRVLADYRRHRPHILPRPPFEGLEVLQGGVGAGTRIKVTMRVLGQQHKAILDVTEPEPGRVLEERDAASGLVTRFSVEPLTAESAVVEIQTNWPKAATLEQRIEARMAAAFLRNAYRRELGNLCAYLVEGRVYAR
jgi:hypothetical protein